MTPTEFQILSARMERIDRRQDEMDRRMSGLELSIHPIHLPPQTSPTIDDQFEPRHASLSDVLQASIEKESRERKKRPWVKGNDQIWHWAKDGDGDKNAEMLCGTVCPVSPFVAEDSPEMLNNPTCHVCANARDRLRTTIREPVMNDVASLLEHSRKSVFRETAIIDDTERDVRGLAGAAAELMAPDETYPVAQDNPVTNHDARFLRDVAELLDVEDEDPQMPAKCSRHVPKRLHEIACKIERSFGTKTPIIRKESESRNSK